MDNSRVTSLSFSPCGRYLALGFWNDAFAVLENVRAHAYRCNPLYPKCEFWQILKKPKGSGLLFEEIFEPRAFSV
jgi:hypothetical protein